MKLYFKKIKNKIKNVVKVKTNYIEKVVALNCEYVDKDETVKLIIAFGLKYPKELKLSWETGKNINNSDENYTQKEEKWK